MTSSAQAYFDDMCVDNDGNTRISDLTDGVWTMAYVYANRVYLARTNEKDKIERGPEIGRVLCLTGETHYKSMAFPGFYNIVFEEAITDTGYLGNEVSAFMSIVSTVLRKNAGRIFLIGNTLTQVCPYFDEWQLINVGRQKQGTIDIYRHHTGQIDESGNEITIKIAVEYCEYSARATLGVFGSRMVSRGEWESKAMPHLSLSYGQYQKHVKMLFDNSTKRFVIELLTKDKLATLYVYPYTKNEYDDEKFFAVIGKSSDLNIKYRYRLDPKNKIDSIYLRLWALKRVCYSDNLSGTTFENILKNNNIF